jgi:hypothetical protein
MATKRIGKHARVAPESIEVQATINKAIAGISTQEMAEYIRDLSRELADMAHATRLDLIAYHLTIVSREAAIAARGGARDERVEI